MDYISWDRSATRQHRTPANHDDVMTEPTSMPEWLQWLAWYIQDEPLVVLVAGMGVVIVWLVRDRARVLRKRYKENGQ